MKELEKMVLVLKDGRRLHPTTISNNQYHTVEGEHVMDGKIDYIENDVRLLDFYCCSKAQGTYEECVEAIKAERALIKKCDECWWHHKFTRVEDLCSKVRTKEGNRKTIVETTVYDISCDYVPKHSETCVHDIEEEPKLFRELHQCFFCEYPEGVSVFEKQMREFKQFLIDNHEKYGIIPRWGDGKLTINDTLQYKKLFGSYKFEMPHWNNWFELSNARNTFEFYVDFDKKLFILIHYNFDYRIVDKLYENSYRTDGVTIKNYDKFAQWLWEAVDDFNANRREV